MGAILERKYTGDPKAEFSYIRSSHIVYFPNLSQCLYTLKAMCPMIDIAMWIVSTLPSSGKVSLRILIGKRKK